MIIHKRIKELIAFVGTSHNREALTKIHVTDKECVATDGHAMVIMPRSNTLNDDEYPLTNPHIDAQYCLSTPINLDVDVVKNAVASLPKKATLPVLNFIQVGTEGDRAIINAGLPVVRFPAGGTDTAYPNYKAVIPDYIERTPITFAVDGKLLEKVCKLARLHGGEISHGIKFTIPTTKNEVSRDSQGEAVLDDNGDPIFEARPIENFNEPIKFSIENDDEMGVPVFHGVIMPLRQKWGASP